MTESTAHQALLEQLQACENQEERERLMMRFVVEQLPEPLRVAVQAAAVPRFFDRAFLNALLDQPLDEAQFAELTGLSYIEPYPGEGRFNVHERSRKLLQEKLWQENEALYREISRRAFVYCKQQDQNDLTWRIETVYHQLVAEPDEGAVVFDNIFMSWMNPPCFAYDKTESLLQAVREHVGMKRLPKQEIYRFWLRQASLYIWHYRYQEAKDVLLRISLTDLQDDLYLKSHCLRSLGDVHLYLSEFPVAQQRYEEALLLYNKLCDRHGEANCLYSLGGLYIHLYNIDMAKHQYKKAVVIFQEIHDYEGEANCLFSIGKIYINRFNFPAAQLCYEEAITLYKKLGDRQGEANCLCAIGDIELGFLKLSAAQQKYEKAIILYKKLGDLHGQANCLQSQGDVHFMLSKFSAAWQLYEEALQLYRKINSLHGEANCLKSFGMIAAKNSQVAAAKEYYNQAFSLFERIQYWEGVAECLEGVAELHQAQNQLPQAEEYWHKAAAMYRQLSMPLRAEHCLEQLRQMKEHKQPADVRHEVSDKQTPPADE